MIWKPEWKVNRRNLNARKAGVDREVERKVEVDREVDQGVGEEVLLMTTVNITAGLRTINIDRNIKINLMIFFVKKHQPDELVL